MSATDTTPQSPATTEHRVAFPSWVTHDLRQPLVQLVGFSDLLALRCDDERQLSWVGNIQQAGRELDRMLDNLGQLADATTLRPLAEPQAIDLEAALSEIVTATRERTSDPHAAAVTVDTLEVGSPSVAVPHRTFGTIATQLICNAIQHATESPVTVTAVARAMPAHGWSLVLEVANIGDPIRPDLEDQIFEPFVRGDPPGGGRLGIGLAIARANAVRLGGTLRTERRGASTVFIAELSGDPRRRSTDPPRTDM